MSKHYAVTAAHRVDHVALDTGRVTAEEIRLGLLDPSELSGHMIVHGSSLADFQPGAQLRTGYTMQRYECRVRHADVEPTNNHAERELRAFVLWRKRSFGTQSKRGNLFAERLMTVAHTARKQHKNVLAFLTACCIADRNGEPAPLLVA